MDDIIYLAGKLQKSSNQEYYLVFNQTSTTTEGKIRLVFDSSIYGNINKHIGRYVAIQGILKASFDSNSKPDFYIFVNDWQHFLQYDGINAVMISGTICRIISDKEFMIYSEESGYLLCKNNVKNKDLFVCMPIKIAGSIKIRPYLCKNPCKSCVNSICEIIVDRFL